MRSLVGDVKGPCFHTIHLSLNKFEIWFGWEICSGFDTNYWSLFPVLQEHFVLRGEVLLGDDVLLIRDEDNSDRVSEDIDDVKQGQARLNSAVAFRSF